MRTVQLTIAFLSIALSTAAGADAVRVGGTGGALGTMRHLSAPFARTTGVPLEVLDSLGSSGAVRAVTDGVIDVAVTARPLKPSEAQAGLISIRFARTPLVFVTSHPNPTGFTKHELVNLFAAMRPVWPDGTPVALVLRPRSDTDNGLIEQAFPGMKASLAAARARPELPIAATDQDNVDLAEKLPGSLVQAGLSQIVTERRALRFVVIDGVAPSPQSLASGAYPYEKPFYIVFAAARREPADRLLAYLRSPDGRKLLMEAGNLPE